MGLRAWLSIHQGIFTSDQRNFAIRNVDKAGTITTVAGCGPDISCLESGGFLGGLAIKTHLNPYDVVLDKAGNVYATDGSRNCVTR